MRRFSKFIKNMFKIPLSPKGEQGQALLFVIVSLTVALAVGVSTALRTLSSVSRVVTTDTSVRVLAAAEGGLENFLSYTTSQLKSAVTTCNTLEGTANPACIVEFSPIPTDNIAARAIVKVEEFKGDPSDSYRYRTYLNKGESATLNLAGYSGNLYACWSGDSDLFFNYFDVNAINWDQKVICADGISCYSDNGNVSGSGVVYANPTPAACSSLGAGYHGYIINIPSSGTSEPLQKGISFIALNDGISLVVQNSTGTAPFTPVLGYRITSKGELLEDSVLKTTKVVSVTRSLPYLSPNLLFGLFSDTGINSFGSYMEMPEEEPALCCHWRILQRLTSVL